MSRRLAKLFVCCGAVAAGLLTLCTWLAIEPLPERLGSVSGEVKKVQVLDRDGQPLSTTYQNEWNLQDRRALSEIPEFLQSAFVAAEDKRFFEHHGVDWRARLHAAWQNLIAGRALRGASTITEQVVRLLHPRPRTVWSRWVEGFEAAQLEERFSKDEILEFYLNQVPYAARRRGVVQAARFYWDRDLDTLSRKEMLALAVMVRAPVKMDLFQGRSGAAGAIDRLIAQLVSLNGIDKATAADIAAEGLSVARARFPADASHFIRYVGGLDLPAESKARGSVVSTIDSELQRKITAVLQTRVSDLKKRDVTDGAALVVDNRSGEVMAWVNAGAFSDPAAGSQIDAVLTPRQPGSALKPFLYALALTKGWTPATIIDDAPLFQAVGLGLHNYRNYSRTYYGKLRLREALGNSLNIPAVKTVDFTGKEDFLDWLHSFGFRSLDRHPDYYGEGLALGNGEVSLFELVQGYAALANHGVLRPLRVLKDCDPDAGVDQRTVADPEVTSLIADILSDPQARRREFGSGGLLRFPVQTAVKTGTSSDYRDAWAMGFTENYTVGVWMGNLNRTAMHEVSGAIGPALVLRAIFAELSRMREPRPLFLSRKLTAREICPLSGELAGPNCPHVHEWFVPGSEPTHVCSLHSSGGIGREEEMRASPRLLLPTPGLQMARDPRIPDRLEAFPFEIAEDPSVMETAWLVDGFEVARTSAAEYRYLWPLQAGRHEVKARVWRSGDQAYEETQSVRFLVK